MRLRRAHHGLAYLLTGILVLMAVVGLAATQVLPLAERHPERIAGWLSDRAGRPVAFDRVRTQWTRRGPLLELDNLRIGRGTGALQLGDETLGGQLEIALPARGERAQRLHIPIVPDRPRQRGGGDEGERQQRAATVLQGPRHRRDIASTVLSGKPRRGRVAPMQHFSHAPTEAAFVQDPYPFYDRLRAAGDLAWWEDYGMVCAASLPAR